MMFMDEGVGRDDVRPRFAAMLREAEAAGRAGEAHSIVVSDLTRLFRSRRDRERVDRLLEQELVNAVTVAESIDTAKPGGLDRYREAADLVMLAYEGEWRRPDGETRRDLVHRYVASVLQRWLALRAVPAEEAAGALADVRARLLALAARWDSPGHTLPLLAPYFEVAERHEPQELPLAIRALAVVGIRNSALEDLHLAGHIEQWDWRVLTQAAAHALDRFGSLPAGEPVVDVDPFDGLREEFPTATAAFRTLAELRPGGESTWERPHVPPPAPVEADGTIPLSREGAEVQHAMDERISTRIAALLRECVHGERPLLVPSLKHVSRNPRKLFRVADYMLAHGGSIVTANLRIGPDRIAWRTEPVEYNSSDLRWAGYGDIAGATRQDLRVGRNDPCPCGSGRKFKRCCGR
jgi:hypothetical protein